MTTVKKILLVKPVSEYYYTLAPNLGLGYLAAALRNAGHQVTIMECDRHKITFGKFRGLMAKHKYDLVGFQLYTHGLHAVVEQARAVREHMPGAVIVAGGPHASGDPEHTMLFLKDLDYVVCGEGERAVPALAALGRPDKARASALSGIKNIAYRSDAGGVIVNQKEYITDLEEVPMPAWDLINPRNYPNAPHGTFARRFPIAPIVTSRGCPYQCTFCASFQTHGRKIRRRLPASVVNEIELLTKRYGVREIHIEDDNFTLGKEYAREVLQGILDRGIRVLIALPNGVRLDALDAKLLKLMERAGVYSFGVGIESGSDRILEKMKKNLKTKEIEQHVAFVRRHSRIRMTGFFLIGHPDETEDDMAKSLELAMRLKIDRVSFSPLMPLPGSLLYEEWKKRIDINAVDWKSFLYYQFVPGMSPIDSAHLEKILQKMNVRFYLRPRIMIKLLREIRSFSQLKMLLKRGKTILAG